MNLCKGGIHSSLVSVPKAVVARWGLAVHVPMKRKPQANVVNAEKIGCSVAALFVWYSSLALKWCGCAIELYQFNNARCKLTFAECVRETSGYPLFFKKDTSRLVSP